MPKPTQGAIRKLIRVLAVSAVAASSVALINSPSANAAVTETPQMVKDIVAGSNDLATFTGDVRIFMDGDVAYFSASSAGGDGLWKSDGTAAGTVLVASATDMGGAAPNTFVKMGTDIYFMVQSGSNRLVKKYDGSTVTTVASGDLVKNAINGAAPASDYIIVAQSLWVAGSYVYFVAPVVPGLSQYDLFRTDGTTLTRATQRANYGDSSFGPVFELDGETYYFVYLDVGLPGIGKISSANFVSTDLGNVSYSSPQKGKVVVLPGSPDRAYALMQASPGGYTILTFDGTNASVVTDGTTRIQYAGLPTRVGNRVYFVGSDNSANGFETLWYTSNSSASVVISLPLSSSFANEAELGGQGSINNETYVFFQEGASGVELWRSDGTGAGTYKVANTDVSNGNASSIAWLYAAQGEMFFASVFSGDSSLRLRKTDGTVAGTSTTFDLTPGVTVPSRFAQGSSITFFIAETFGFGKEIHAVLPAGTTPPPNSNGNTNSGTNTGGSNSSGGNTSGNTSSSSTSSNFPTDTEISSFKTVTLVPGGSVTAGQTYEVTASGFTASENVNAYLQGSTTSLGVSKASATGTATVKVKIPKNTSGKKTLIVFGSTSRHGVKQSVVATATVTELPATGAQAYLWTWFALAAIVCGAGIRRLRRVH